MKITNAIIKYATISTGDYGALTVWLTLDYGGECQGFGGYSLYSPNRKVGHAGHFIFRVMQIADVGKWDDLIGKTIRVEAEHNGVKRIGHILKDDWFCPDEDLKGGDS